MSKTKLFTILTLPLLFSFGNVRGQNYVQFPIPDNPITLHRPVQPWTDFTVVGRCAFFIGKENGITEAWVVPFKILHDLKFQATRGGRQYNLELSDLARYIWVRPEATTIRFVHSGFTIDATYFAPIESRGLVILFHIKSSEKLTLTIQFKSDLQPMWPGGLGGQFSYWDNNEKAFIISESRGKYAGLIGSPYGSAGTSTPAHAQPDAPVQFIISIDPDSVQNRFIPVVIAGFANGIDEAKSNYKNILHNIESLYQQTFDHYKKIRQEFLTADLPDVNLSLALEWAKVALDKGLIDNPQLGRGLVAGFGPSGKSARPGFAWYFGGDAAINCWAINDYGDQETVKQSLKFFIKYQRQDGKITHEISQSAGMLPWFEEYPYAYYHAETTPLFLIAVDDYLGHSGDLSFIKDNWQAIFKAFEYCISADSNEDGLMDNVKAGLGAVELGDLRKKETEVDIYLAAVWTKALDGMVRIAKAKGDEKLSRDCKIRFEKARQVLNEKFWQEDKDLLSFAVMTDGSTIDDITTWMPVPLCFDFIPPKQADLIMNKLQQADMSTDWGIHFLTKSSPKYQYSGYNTGAVWPFTTMFTIWGGFRSGHFEFAKKQWENVAALTFSQQLGTISELFSGDRFQPIEAAVPHQLFSTTPVLVGFTRGILGLEPNVPNNELKFEPNWPRDWTSAHIKNIPFGKNKLMLEHNHSNSEISLKWHKEKNSPIVLILSYSLLADETIKSVELNGLTVPFELATKNAVKFVQSKFTLNQTITNIVLKGNFRVKQLKKRLELQIGAEKRQ